MINLKSLSLKNRNISIDIELTKERADSIWRSMTKDEHNRALETIPTPLFTIEKSEIEGEMIVRLSGDTDQFVIMSSDYYLVDWEETEDGFNAIFGRLDSLDIGNEEVYRDQLEIEFAHQPWDYRSVS